jgi:hypothetical protein
MPNHFEELRVRRYQEHLMSIAPAQWQWFAKQQCFEVGDAAARPRVYFDIAEQFGMYVLSIYLEVDESVVGSNVVHVGKPAPDALDDLLEHLVAMDHLPVLGVLLVRLLRNRGTMQTTAVPVHVKARIENCLTIVKQRVLVDLPHNVQERVATFKIERSASRVLPRTRRG